MPIDELKARRDIKSGIVSINRYAKEPPTLPMRSDYLIYNTKLKKYLSFESPSGQLTPFNEATAYDKWQDAFAAIISSTLDKGAMDGLEIHKVDVIIIKKITLD